MAMKMFGLLLFVLVVILIRSAWGGGAYPPISFLAQELQLAAGQPLPKGVIWNGRPYFFYIKSASQLANGEYDVRIKSYAK